MRNSFLTRALPYLEAGEFFWVKLAGWLPSQRLRRLMFRMAGGRVGTGTVLYGGLEGRSCRKIRIGKDSSIGHACILDGRGGLTIGDSVNLSTGVWIWTAEHDVQDRGFRGTLAPVSIEDYAWVGSRVVILPGTTVARGAVVASGAVVTKDVAAHTIVGGVPAKVIGRRSPDLDYKLGSCIPFI